jgi:hypothetical protein
MDHLGTALDTIVVTPFQTIVSTLLQAEDLERALRLAHGDAAAVGRHGHGARVLIPGVDERPVAEREEQDPWSGGEDRVSVGGDGQLEGCLPEGDVRVSIGHYARRHWVKEKWRLNGLSTSTFDLTLPIHPSRQCDISIWYVP